MTKPSCFMIMPITTPESLLDDYGNDPQHFEKVEKYLFVPAIERAGFTPISPKTEGSNLIQAKIIENLEKCDMVLCDMSILNPNVFFELGIRCAKEKPVTFVIDDITKTKKIPFDLSPMGCQEYKGLPTFELTSEIEKLASHITSTYAASAGKNIYWSIYSKDSSNEVFSDFTDQELLVLYHMSQGNSNKKIAKILTLGEGTVRNYGNSIFDKLDLKNRTRTSASKIALENNLLGYITQKRLL